MINGRVRIRSAKGKRWSEGHSSNSNPQTNKHRTAARGEFSDHLALVGAGGRDTLERGVALTTNAPLLMMPFKEIRMSEALSNVSVEEEQSDKDEHTSSPSMVSTSTAYSLIETSHPIFGRVKRLWNSGMESHREICAVLAAVSEVVKTSGGEDTVTEYLGTLVTALESADDEKSSIAIAYLLSIVMPKAPVEVLQSRYGVICKVFADKLSSYEMSDSTSLLKSLVTCLTTLLGAQVGSTWNESYTKRVFQLLLNYTLHPKPKLRKAAQNGVVSMLREGTLSGDFHPAALLTVTRVIEKGNSEITVLHILGLLEECLANMKAIHIKSLCELILKLILAGNSIIRSTAFKTLHGLFLSVAGPRGLTPQDSAKLISVRITYRISMTTSLA